MDEIKPSLRSRLIVFRLLIEALIDVALLPFRIVVFLIRRKKVSREIRRLLEQPRENP